MKTVVCVVGPTASGKTSLGIELAERLGTEVISADSMQVYKGMNILSSKPSMDERRGVVHNMMDVCDIEDDFCASKYTSMSRDHLERLFSLGKIPIVVGGTGLYTDTLLLKNNFCGINRNDEIRAELLEFYNINGAGRLYQRLHDCDPAAANSTHVNNVKRVVRLLESYITTGITFDEYNLKYNNLSQEYNTVFIGINSVDREYLYDRINKRVDSMLNSGLLEEVMDIYKNRRPGITASCAIGYKELCLFLNGELSFDDSVCKIKQSTRNYAKRQLTWFRRNKNINWIEYEKYDNNFITNKATKILFNNGLKYINNVFEEV